MEPVYIVLIILSVAFLLIGLFAVPCLLQLWRTTKVIAETLELINKSLPDILKNLEEITQNINSATNKVNDQIDGLSLSLEKLQGLIDVIADVEKIFLEGVRSPLIRSLGVGFAIIKGLRVFIDTFRMQTLR